MIRKFFVYLFIIMISQAQIACSYQALDTADSAESNTSFDSAVGDNESLGSQYNQSDIISFLVDKSEKINEEFAAWLLENENPAAMSIYISCIKNGASYSDILWYEHTHKSINVLYDSFMGLLDSSESMKNTHIYNMTAQNTDKIILGFAGDVSFAPDYSHAKKYASEGIDGAFPGKIQDIMKGFDVFILNNEFCYSTNGTPQPGKTYTFRADPARANWLLEMGVDAVTLANNHAFDYGEEAFVDTLKTLNSINMPFAGGGMNIEEASSPMYLIVNGIKIACISTTEIEGVGTVFSKGATETEPGLFRFNNPELLKKTISKAKSTSDYVIVLPHWGTERVQELQPHQQEMAYIMADSGADLIVGGHTHVLQGLEYYNNTPIFYSLGNFSFNDRILDCAMLEIELDINGIISSKFLPCIEKNGATILCDKGDTDYNRMIASLNNNSASGILINDDGYVVH